jgi:signal transduction histidine kinase
MNPSAAAMTEWPIAEAVGVDALMVLKFNKENGEPLPDDEKDQFTAVLKSNEHVNTTLQLTGRNNKTQVVSLVVSPVANPKNNTLVGAVAVMRDISDQRAVEKQRADFISTAAHEMRTPVAAIEGYLSLALNEKVSTIDTRARGYLEKAHTSTQHLGKLFQDLLTSSKAEDGRLSNHPVVVEMGVFMQQLSDDLKFAAEKKGLFAEFIVGASDTIDATVKDAALSHIVKPLYYVLVDPDRMREVVTNLFDNATKYTEQGKISIGLTGDTDVVQIYVRDTGSGIPKEDIPHLFQKFYRVDNSATRTIGGTGLGLFICRKIVELYHGRIWVESELGKGSTFFINLPRLSTQRATELQATEASTQATQATMPTSTSLK